MSTKAQVKTQAKTPAAPGPAHVGQPPVAVSEREAERPDIAEQLEGAARLGHSLGAVSVDSSPPPIIQRQEIPEEEELQLKREPAAVQRQEIPEEEEAELQMMAAPPGQVALQRQEIPEEEEEELMLKPEEGQVGPQGGPVPPEVEAAIQRARGGGQPLERALQEQMGASLGHDFSGVRVHTDAEADALNQQLTAKAFTTGRDIFFRRGAYEPGSSSGRELIAHELSHVVQQSTGRVSRGGGMMVRPAGDAFEQEADTLNQQFNAKAFTTQNDLLFRQGEYSPGSDSGKKLSAHELTHVMQQQAAPAIQQQGKDDGSKKEEEIADDPPGKIYEQEADKVTDAVTSDNASPARQITQAAPTQAVQRHCWQMNEEQERSFLESPDVLYNPNRPHAGDDLYYRFQNNPDDQQSSYYSPLTDEIRQMMEDQIVDQNERARLAVLHRWTNEFTYFVTYAGGEKGYIGTAGPQEENNDEGERFQGGGDQVVFPTIKTIELPENEGAGLTGNEKPDRVDAIDVYELQPGET
jgi:hypothetical protein